MNLVKKINLYFKYRSALLKHKKEILNKFGLKIDMVNRMYTVINIPDSLGEPYNVRKADIDKMTEDYMKNYFSSISEYFNSIGMSEMYDLQKPIERLDKLSYLIVIGFKFLDTARSHSILIYGILPLLIILPTIYFFFLNN